MSDFTDATDATDARLTSVLVRGASVARRSRQYERAIDAGVWAGHRIAASVASVASVISHV